MAGTSLSSLPRAPGAPFGQSGMESFISARKRREEAERMASAKGVFMVCLAASPTPGSMPLAHRANFQKVFGLAAALGLVVRFQFGFQPHYQGRPETNRDPHGHGDDAPN